MTDIDFLAFRECVVAVAAGRGKAVSDAMLDGLWSLVDDLPFADFKRGLVAAAKVTRFFPSAPEIRAHIRAQHDRDAVRPSTLAALEAGEVHCPACDDTGWAPCVKDASHVYGAGTTVPAVRRCACRATNPIYRARRVHDRRVGGRAHDEG